MVNINLNIQKKDLWLLLAIMVFLIGVGFVIASYPYSQSIPNPGHGADNVWVDINGIEMNLQSAMGNGITSAFFVPCRLSGGIQIIVDNGIVTAVNNQACVN